MELEVHGVEGIRSLASISCALSVEDQTVPREEPKTDIVITHPLLNFDDA